MSRGIEKRKDLRLPYGHKVIVSDGTRSVVVHASNISRGGFFLKSLDPLPLDSTVTALWYLPGQRKTLCCKGKIVHVVFDRFGEVESGMGLQFQNVNALEQSILDEHFVNERRNYLELKQLLDSDRPNIVEIVACLKRMHQLEELDLLALKYRVQRICALFQQPSLPLDEKQSA